jgi:hypothetical protein
MIQILRKVEFQKGVEKNIIKTFNKISYKTTFRKHSVTRKFKANNAIEKIYICQNQKKSKWLSGRSSCRESRKNNFSRTKNAGGG